MLKNKSFHLWPHVVSLVAVALVIGFFAGTEYKAWQVRSALAGVFSGGSESSAKQSEKTVLNPLKDPQYKVIDQVVGDEITLATMKLKINKVEKRQTLSKGYGTPEVAQAGTVYLVLDMTVTNAVDAPFTFDSDGLLVMDSEDKQYTAANDVLFSVDDYLEFRDLAPGIPQTGKIVFQVPEKSQDLSFIVGKGGTNDVYKIKL